MKNSLRLLSVVLSLTAGAWCQANSGAISSSSTTCPAYPTTSTACVVLPLTVSNGGATLTLSGTFSATVQFEASGDGGATWVSMNATPLNSTTAAASATGVGTWQANVAGVTQVRIRCSTYSSGTVTATIYASNASARSGGGGTGGGGITSINGDTTAAQIIAQGTGISVSTAAGTTTVTNTSPGAASAGAATAVQSSNGSGAFVDSGCTATGASITCSNGVSGGPVAHLATYGACNTGATAYKFAGIDDGTTNVIGATVSGGGSIAESVFCNTTAWTCAGGCTAPSGSFTAAGDLSGNATSQNVINAHWTVHATVTSGPYTVAATDYIIPCDATSGTIVLNLPAATGSGKPYAFKKLDASANACAITPNGTDTIDTVNAAQNITTQYANQMLVDSASGKWIRGQIVAMAGAITGASNNTSIAVGSLPNGMTATTQTVGDNTTNVATDAFVLANVGAAPIYDTPVSVTEITSTATVGTPIIILDGISNTTTQVLQFSFTASMSSTSNFTSCSSAGKISLYIEGTDADNSYVFGAVGGAGALAESASTAINFMGGTPQTYSFAGGCNFGNSLTALAAKCIGFADTVSFKANTVAKLFFNQPTPRAAGCTGIVDEFYPRVIRIR